MSKKIVDEVLKEIRNINKVVGSESIPHSDEFLNKIASSIGIGTELSNLIIRILINSHYIFAIEIVSRDELRNIPKIEGYIEANLRIISELKSYFESELMVMYETEYQKRLLPHQVIKELFPIIRSLNNTPIGRIANKAIMLNEYERLLETKYSEYTEEWKANQLQIELKNANLTEELEKQKIKEPAPEVNDNLEKENLHRAIDSEEYDEFMSRSKSYPIEKVITIYGVEFFIRVNLRKCNFSLLKDIIDSGKMFKRSDLLIIKDMLSKVKMNIDKDQKLSQYEKEIQSLEHSITHNLYFKAAHK
ncbi:MAG: hypothetical protein SVR08_10640 [Spirochaetota bacterium]|nr:hypothetical protein [Spirochaetota bacterium]